MTSGRDRLEYRLALTRGNPPRTVTYPMGINERGLERARESYERHSMIGDTRIEVREVGPWIPIADTTRLELEEDR